MRKRKQFWSQDVTHSCPQSLSLSLVTCGLLNVVNKAEWVGLGTRMGCHPAQIPLLHLRMAIDPSKPLFFIGPYNLHYLLFSRIGASLCHHPYCYPSQSQTVFGIGAGRPCMTTPLLL